MKWISTLCVGVILGIASQRADAQQLPHFSYFTYNYINYNPAVTGFTPCPEMRLGYRQQWVGFEGSPASAFAVAHGRVGVKRKSFHGLGGYIENDAAGPFSYTSLHGNYAFHLKLSKGYTLSSGISVGFSQNRIDFGKMTLEIQQNDPAITSSVSEFIFPQINMGFWLYKSNRFYGVSLRQVRQSTIEDLEPQSLRTHMTMSYGAAIVMSEDVTFKPAALLNYVGRSRASVEAQAVFDYRQIIALGAGMRSGNGFSALLKIDMIRYLTLIYAYDLTLSKLRFDSSGSHEVTLGFRACSDAEKGHVPCAAYN
ncbi:MAG: type IX secretion system membrane protein PorP/SprF [Flavobacteriales bacterium]